MPKKNEPKTRVVFRVFKGEVTAVFPDMEEGRGDLTCYAHVGQHSRCSRAWIRDTKLATAKQAAPLKRELTKVGYNLKVVKRVSRRK